MTMNMEMETIERHNFFPNLFGLNKKPVKNFVYKAENLNAIIKNRSMQIVFTLIT